jgi:diguanylate cyclase (GGDEF)-like protein
MTKGSLLVLLRWLIEPNASIPASGRRRARLLAWIQLALLVMAGITLPLTLLGSPAGAGYGALFAGFFAALALAIALNRAGRYFASAWLTIIITGVGSWSAVVLENAILKADLVTVSFIVISVFLASILLSAPATAVLAVIQIGILVIIQIYLPALPAVDWTSLVVFVFFMSLLSVVAAVVSRQDLAQIETQSRQLIANEGRLREQSVRDVLTGLFNRRYLEETLERALRRAERGKSLLGVMMIDIDHFKRFNDTYGHAVGDALLRELGALLRANVRGSDIACRYGGEEFILLLPEATFDVTRERAEHIRGSARRIVVRHEGEAIEPITLSIGLAEFPQDGATGEAMLKRADDALYRAKHEGRDQIA